MNHIEKIKLQNFKRFKKFSVECDDKLNILIGDNEAGKSSILLALDLILSGSRSKIETMGLENLFNVEIIQEFLSLDKKYEDLPILLIELYLSDQNNIDLHGKNNTDERLCDGIYLRCEPNDSLSKEIKEILQQQEPNFPFEFYTINFRTFSGESYTGYRKFLRHLLIDNSQISNEYATRAYVKTIYNSNISVVEKNFHQNAYRNQKKSFSSNILTDLNKKLNGYAFAIRCGSQAEFESDLTILENHVSLENRGKGRQCFIKTEFALHKQKSDNPLDVILIEEPENHLSHINMKKLIQRIRESQDRQIFVATHSNMISTRLDLRKCILLNGASVDPIRLNNVSESTSKYFMKASANTLLEFVLSERAILVEGDSEYILMETFFQKVTGKKPEEWGVNIMSVGGTSFKRYLDIAKLLNIRTAVIRDNDGDYENNCINNYENYSSQNIAIFADKDNNRRTFEIILYGENSTICDELFKNERRTLSVQEYLLQNKADVAFELLDKRADQINPPEYIREAIQWIICSF